MGEFLFTAAVGRWGLHRRMATPPVRAIGTASRQSVVGVTVACGSLSMWISNTASVAALLPNAA